MFNVPLLFNNSKNRMVADFYIPTLSNDMKIAAQKNYLGGLILYRSLDHSKKRRHTTLCKIIVPFIVWAFVQNASLITASFISF